jgi:hypothetical protein
MWKRLSNAGRLGVLAALLGAASASAADKVGPEIPVAANLKGEVYLEDLRGLVTVLCFFDDDCS